MDRYFGLPEGLEAAYQALLFEPGAKAPAAAQIERLRRLGVVEDAIAPWAPASAPEPRRDLDVLDGAHALPLRDQVDVLAAWMRARRLLRAWPLERILHWLGTRRERAGPIDVPRLATGFATVRRLIPVEPVCLLDSLALADFLHRRGAAPAFVFAVSTAPFSAHCWLQVGDLVINDHLERALAHTPILVT